MVLKTDYANATPSADQHPAAHNTTNAAVNALETELARLRAAAEGDLLRGIVPLDRRNIGAQTGTGGSRVYLSYATCRENMTVTKARFMMGTTAAAATPTLIKLGIYREESNKDMTLLGQTANDTTMCNTIGALVERPYVAGVPVVAGTRYAVAFIIVSGATLPALCGTVNLTAAGVELSSAPRVNGLWTSQTDLPATIPAGLIVNNNIMYYLVAVP